MDAPWHLVLLLAIVLLVLGPGRLPEAGAAVGRAIHEFRAAADGRPSAPPPDEDRRAP